MLLSLFGTCFTNFQGWPRPIFQLKDVEYHNYQKINVFVIWIDVKTLFLQLKIMTKKDPVSQ